MRKKLKTIALLMAMGLWMFIPPDRALGNFVELADIDSGLTSPTGDYRWRDVADQLYSADYWDNYNYTEALVQVVFDSVGSPFHGTLIAVNLKPNFAYQLKLVGTPWTSANERIGLAGRWWQEIWDGSNWSNGQNLNDNGVGASPNPNDLDYFDRRDLTDPDLIDPKNPNGNLYRYTGYLVFDYFITGGAGNAVVEFETDSSFHVLWKTSQRTHTDDDGPTTSSTFDADESFDADELSAYDDTGGDDYPLQTVDVFGEWERLPVEGVYLQPGDYHVQIILTEESFHGSGVITYAGNWAGAMGANIQFFITYPSDKDKDGDVDGSDLIEYMSIMDIGLEEFAESFGNNDCPY
jgi:hypothetical protein